MVKIVSKVGAGESLHTSILCGYLGMQFQGVNVRHTIARLCLNKFPESLSPSLHPEVNVMLLETPVMSSGSVRTTKQRSYFSTVIRANRVCILEETQFRSP